MPYSIEKYPPQCPGVRFLVLHDQWSKIQMYCVIEENIYGIAEAESCSSESCIVFNALLNVGRIADSGEKNRPVGRGHTPVMFV